jgi:hypothetical protein
MEKKPKVTKLDPGHAQGCETYGSMCRPKSGRNSRTQELRDRAAQRIIALLKKGPQGDRLTRRAEPISDPRQLEYIAFHNKLASSPKLVQFAYWRGKLNELREELKLLEETGNARKVEQNAPTIKSQIEEVENTMRELFEDIKRERRVISRTPNEKQEK